MLKRVGQAGLLLVPGAIAAGAVIPPPGEHPSLSAEEEQALSGALASREWNELRAVWSELTSIEQPDDYLWHSLLTDSEAVAFSDRVNAAMDRLSGRNSSVSGELAVVKRLYMLRLRTLLYGRRSMYTRMMAPAVQMESEQAFVSFENRLDSLRELQFRGLMDPAGIAEAARATLETGVSALLLDTLSSMRLYIWSFEDNKEMPPWELVQMRLAEIRRFADTARGELEDAGLLASEAAASADSVITLLPGVFVLLSDLICDR